MASTVVEKLVTKATINTKGYKRGIQQMKSMTNRASKDISKSFDRSGKSLMRLRYLLSAAIPAAILKLTVTFSRSMHEVWTLTDATTEQFSRMNSDILAMSDKMGKDASNMAKGYYQVISAGITDLDQALKYLETSSRLAIAGVSDVFTAVDILTTVTNSYVGANIDATNASDVLFHTIRVGKTTLPELTHAIGRTAAIAGQAGVAFEDLMAATAALTKSGIQTDIAMIALRGTINDILKPTSASAKLAARLGIDMSLAALKARGLVGVLADIKEKTAGNAEQITKLIPDIRALTAVFALVGPQWESYNKFIEENAAAAGEVEVAYEKMEQSMSRKIERMVTSLKNAGIIIGSEFAPVVIRAASAVTEIVQGFNEWEKSEGVLTKALKTVEIGIMGLALAGRTMLTGFYGIVGSLEVAFKDIELVAHTVWANIKVIVGEALLWIQGKVMALVGFASDLAANMGLDGVALLLDRDYAQMESQAYNARKQIDKMKEDQKDLNKFFDDAYSKTWGGKKADESVKEMDKLIKDIAKASAEIGKVEFDAAKKTAEDKRKLDEAEAKRRNKTKKKIYDKDADEERKKLFEDERKRRLAFDQNADWMRNGLKKETSALQTELSRRLGLNKKYQDDIKRIQKDRVQASLAFEERIYGLRTKNITSTKGMEIQNRAMQRMFEKQAKRASRSGDQAGSRKFLERGLDYAQKTAELHKGKKGEKAIERMRDIQKQIDRSYGREQKQMRERKDKNMQTVQEITNKLDALAKKAERGMAIKVKGEEAEKELKSLKKLLDAIKNKTVTITVKHKKAATGYSEGGTAGIDWKRQGTDSIPAMLTPGEFVMNRMASKRFDPLLRAINSNRVKPEDLSISRSMNSAGPQPTVPATTNNNVSSVMYGGINIYPKEVMSRETIRKEIIPELEKFQHRSRGSRVVNR